MSKRNIMVTVCGGCVAVLLVWSLAFGTDLICPAGERPTVASSVAPPAQVKADPEDYTGWIRLHVVEPTARWKDYNNQGYHFGFLDWALDSAIVLPDGSRYHRTKTWDASMAGWSNVNENNIMVIATIFNSDPHQAYSDPPSGYPFTAYYVDAAAGANAGEVDSNNTTPSSTHTVFVEKGTGSWCYWCQFANKWMSIVYNSGNYNFFYAAMVEDKNVKAHNHLVNDYNIYGYPTCYGDGGDYVLVGGSDAAGPYQTMISTCQQRAVSDIGLLVGVEWIDPDMIKIDVAMAHGTPVNTIPTFPGPASGETTPIIDTSYDYSISCTDAEGDQVYYRWAWGDGDSSLWLGPYNSGDPCSASHSWDALGTYEIRVQSRDPWYKSAWSDPLVVNPTCCIGERGDVNGSGTISIPDVTYLMAYLKSIGPAPPCFEEGDVNGSGTISIPDVTYLMAYLKSIGPAPVACP
jgi:hypothetical protein